MFYFSYITRIVIPVCNTRVGNYLNGFSLCFGTNKQEIYLHNYTQSKITKVVAADVGDVTAFY